MNETNGTANAERRERGEGRIFSRKHTRNLWVQYYDARGAQIRVSAETDNPKKARAFLREKIGEVKAGVHRDTRRLTYDDLRGAFLADYRVNRRKSLRFDKEGDPYLDKVDRLDSYFSGWHISQIDADSIRKFTADQQGRGLSNGSINRSISALRRMFNLAVEDGKLRNVPHFPMLKEAAARQGFFEEDQYKRLLAVLPDYLQSVLAIGYYTGMRLSEVLGLEWAQVDFLAGTINLRAGETKNDEARMIPIVPQLAVVLRGRRHPSCPFVCFRLDRKGHPARIGNFRKVWYTRCVKLGLGTMKPATDAEGNVLYDKPRGGKRSKPKPKMIYTGLIYHDLRRTGVRNLVDAGVPEKTAMAISGHKTRAVFDRYNIVSKKNVADAGRKLAEFHARKVGDTSGTHSTEMQHADSSVQ